MSEREERWRPVPDFEGVYEVSDEGRVRSLPRWRVPTSRLLNPTVEDRGYRNVHLRRPGLTRRSRVHVLVMAAFVGPRPEGKCIRHINGNPLDNRLENLCYDTYSENMRDRARHGTDHNVAKTHCPQGHPYSAENTVTYNGSRYCRTCARRYKREYAARRRAANKAAA